ncbi:MAG: hypothetical protein Q4F00_07920 [bacterium]|nr:hypothetical protein [bacterium]
MASVSTSFYKMWAHTNLEEFVCPGEEIKVLASACRTSSFQFLDRQPLTVEIEDSGGLTFPDFLYNYDVPLISLRFKKILDKLGVDNLFYKPVYLDCAALGRHEPYILALPPRIRAVRRVYTRLADEDGDESEGRELCRDEHGLKHYKINASEVGNYRIFKLADVIDTDIIVTRDLQAAIKKASLVNVCFSEAEED